MAYAFTNSRVKGMKSNLLGAAVMRELLSVRTPDEIAAILEQSPYRQDFVRLSQQYSGLELIDKALHENFVRTIKSVFRSMPPQGRKAFEVLAGEWLAGDIKKIIAKKSLGESIGESELVVLDDKNRSFFKRLIAARNAEDTVDVLSHGFGGKEFRKSLAREKDFRTAISEVDKELGRQLASQSAGMDVLSAEIIRKKIEYQDALVALRLKREGLKHSEISRFLLAPSHGVAKKIAASHSFEAGLEVVASEFAIDKQIIEGARQSQNMVPLEVALERNLVQAVLRATRISVLSFATVLGFFYLKQIEVENIRKIAFANAFGLREEMAQYVFALNE